MEKGRHLYRSGTDGETVLTDKDLMSGNDWYTGGSMLERWKMSTPKERQKLVNRIICALDPAANFIDIDKRRYGK